MEAADLAVAAGVGKTARDYTVGMVVAAAAAVPRENGWTGPLGPSRPRGSTRRFAADGPVSRRMVRHTTEGGRRLGWRSETCQAPAGYRMSIGAGDGKDRRKEEVVRLRRSAPEECFAVTAGWPDPTQKMGGGRSVAGAEVVARAVLFIFRSDQIRSDEG